MTARIFNHSFLPLLAGMLTILCTSCTTLHGAWYYQTSGMHDQNQKLFLALLNDSKRKTYRINHVLVNGSSNGFLGISKNHGPAIWSLSRDNQEIWSMPPGSLLVLELETDPEQECQVPIDARVEFKDQTEKRAAFSQRVRIEASMPTTLPNAWVSCNQRANADSLEPAVATSASTGKVQ